MGWVQMRSLAPFFKWSVERTIQIIEDVLRACVKDIIGNWNNHLSLIEFSYNNSYRSSIAMAPFEEL